MTTPSLKSSSFESYQLPVQIKLAAAWTSFMFLYIYVDYLVLHKPGHVEDILAGIIWEFEISQTFVTIALISISIPTFMILLSMVMPARVNRPVNLVVATLYIPYSLFNAIGESWTIFFGLSIGLEIVLLSFILRSAWTWPRNKTSQDDAILESEHLYQASHA